MTRMHRATSAEQITSFAARSLLFIALGITLAGCETTQPQDYTGSIWSNYRERHPISIVEKDRTLKIFVGSERNGLTPDQRTSVLDYSLSWRGEGTGRFVIEQPTGARNAQSASAALREIRSIMAAAGVPSSSVRVRSYRIDRNMLAVITINYPHTVAQVGPCGQWPDDLGPTADAKHFENVQYWNFGCSTQRALAAQVANPSDLVQPRAEGPVYAMRRTMVLDKYRKGESPATTDPNADKGKISDLGK
jgi:pilus assembly protein CpaD